MADGNYRLVRRSDTETGSGFVRLFIEDAHGTEFPIVLSVDEAENMIAAVSEQISIAKLSDPPFVPRRHPTEDTHD